MITTLGQYQTAVDAALAALEQDDVMARIWAHDHTVWKNDPAEITNRLGWLTIADAMQEEVTRLKALVAEVQADGYTHALLLGMGGSSLAPEVFRLTFGVAEGYLDLAVLDSTDPGVVLAYAAQLDLSKTLFFVSTKSGGTVETLSFFKYFYNRVVEVVGAEAAGAHFVAITDPGSKLEVLAQQYNFRATLINDPHIGGRYSVLSFFGLAPAAMIGVDVPQLLSRAQAAAQDANGPLLGVIMGELALAGRDKLTLITSPAINSFSDWVEQLVAESTGKEGKGILPVVGEPVGSPDVYSDDRLFVYMKLADDTTHDAAVQALEDAGQPVVRIDLQDVYDLGAGFFLWEIATAVASYRLAINPFDQPNVESAKVLARQMVAAYHETGELPTLTPTLTSDDITVYGNVAADNPGAALKAFVAQGAPGAYIALQAYIQPTVDADAALRKLSSALRATTGYAVTIGYGPRFLHSTGQLHKGDGGNGLFIQFTAAMPQDADIPDEAGKPESAMTFGVLKESQALGDRQALLDAGRKVIRFDLGADVSGALDTLTAALT
ncbi:MAG: glucose-6-phosphate isomerase [Anaerolineae bacterium]|nr:glucose-6-phosphate isomerase [Anaerolineae bacterium]